MPRSHPERAFADGSPLVSWTRGKDESRARRWLRRLVSVGVYTLLWALALGLAPVLLPLAWVIDRLRGIPVLLPTIALLTLYLTCEVIGVLVACAMWLGSLTWLGASRHRYLRWNFWGHRVWMGTIFGAARRMFRWRIEVTGDDAVERGNMLLFIRHVSTADTILAAAFVSIPHRIFLRYVLKEELLWDPCLDIVGNRLPNAFVRRGTGESERARAEIARVTECMGPYDGVLIYPEGTRFTQAKRERILARLAENVALEHRDADPRGQDASQRLERARALTHVLPPRLTGPLTLLESAPDADVVFCAHTGLEQALSVREFMAGGLDRVVLKIGFWRVPRADIPEERDARIDWLYREWQRVDDWIAERAGTRDESAT